MSEEKEALAAASQQILLGLAEFLLANDFNHKDFATLSRQAFFEAGTKILESRDEFAINRLLEITGLSRNEVSRAEARPPSQSRGSETTWSNAMNGLHKWHTHSDFVDKNGAPRVVDLTDPEVFFDLFEVDNEGGDELLAELVDAGSIEQISEKEWQPISRYYIPKKRVLTFHYFGQAVSRLISTLNRNINKKELGPWVERSVSAVNLTTEARPLFAKVGKEQALRFVESLDDWTSSNEVEPQLSETSDSTRIGLGVYYFEEKP